MEELITKPLKRFISNSKKYAKHHIGELYGYPREDSVRMSDLRSPKIKFLKKKTEISEKSPEGRVLFNESYILNKSDVSGVSPITEPIESKENLELVTVKIIESPKLLPNFESIEVETDTKIDCKFSELEPNKDTKNCDEIRAKKSFIKVKVIVPKMKENNLDVIPKITIEKNESFEQNDCIFEDNKVRPLSPIPPRRETPTEKSLNDKSSNSTDENPFPDIEKLVSYHENQAFDRNKLRHSMPIMGKAALLAKKNVDKSSLKDSKIISELVHDRFVVNTYESRTLKSPKKSNYGKIYKSLERQIEKGVINIQQSSPIKLSDTNCLKIKNLESNNLLSVTEPYKTDSFSPNLTKSSQNTFYSPPLKNDLSDKNQSNLEHSQNIFGSPPSKNSQNYESDSLQNQTTSYLTPVHSHNISDSLPSNLSQNYDSGILKYQNNTNLTPGHSQNNSDSLSNISKNYESGILKYQNNTNLTSGHSQNNSDSLSNISKNYGSGILNYQNSTILNPVENNQKKSDSLLNVGQNYGCGILNYQNINLTVGNSQNDSLTNEGQNLDSDSFKNQNNTNLTSVEQSQNIFDHSKNSHNVSGEHKIQIGSSLTSLTHIQNDSDSFPVNTQNYDSKKQFFENMTENSRISDSLHLNNKYFDSQTQDNSDLNIGCSHKKSMDSQNDLHIIGKALEDQNKSKTDEISKNFIETHFDYSNLDTISQNSDNKIFTTEEITNLAKNYASNLQKDYDSSQFSSNSTLAFQKSDEESFNEESKTPTNLEEVKNAEDTMGECYDMDEFLKKALGDELENTSLDMSQVQEEPKVPKSKSIHPEDSVCTSDASDLISKIHSFQSTFYRSLTKKLRDMGNTLKSPGKKEECTESEDDLNSFLPNNEQVTDLVRQAAVQYESMKQISKALTLCKNTKEFFCSTEQIEGERLLLIAIHKRQALLNEIRRLDYELEECPSPNFGIGSVTISDIYFPMKSQEDPLNKKDFTRLWYLCILSQGPRVLATQLTPPGEDGNVFFSEQFSFPDLPSDFGINVEIFSLLQRRSTRNFSHESKFHLNKDIKNSHCPTPKHFIQKDSKTQKLFRYDTGIQTSSFKLNGVTKIRVFDICQKGPWPLRKVPLSSNLTGFVNMKLQSKVAISIKHSGFLTIGNEIGGSISWNRRWCVLNEHILHFWNYPSEDIEPLLKIDMKKCINAQIEPVERTLCAKSKTLLMEIKEGGIFKYFFCADSVSEMESWKNQLNKVLNTLRTWGECCLN